MGGFEREKGAKRRVDNDAVSINSDAVKSGSWTGGQGFHGGIGRSFFHRHRACHLMEKHAG
jgi:hypothetical protein